MADPSALAVIVHRATMALREDGPHRPPTPGEAADVVALADALADADTTRARGIARRLGLAELHSSDGTGGPGGPGGPGRPDGPDGPDGRAPLLLGSDARGARSWLVVAAPAAVPGAVVQVPHPYADIGTERVGLAILARLPDALYLQSGAHRRAGAPPGTLAREGFPADPAARPDSAFALLADRLVARLGVPQLQVHGFAERADRDFDVVASAGTAPAGRLLDAVVATLRATGERVRLGDDPACADLAGNRNVQGLSAARHGTAFVHLELSRALRRDAARRDAVADAVATAVRASQRRPRSAPLPAM